jgi:hypothetical protein
VVAPAVLAVFLTLGVKLLSRNSILRRIRVVGSCLALVTSVFAEPPFAGPTEVGRLAAPPRNETSGLAASCRTADLLWTHDDSGGEPVLYAVGTDGKLRGSVRISRVKNVDWEDIASGQLDDRPCLVIADVGDNSGNRTNAALHIIEEPPTEKLYTSADIVAPPIATLRLSYEDAPRDCEAVALDAKERAIYLLTKRDDVPRLYRVALPLPLANADVRARFVGFVPRLPQPSGIQKMIKGPMGKHRGWPTGMDFTADGTAAVVLTYGDLSWFPRRAGETWADALARDPVVLPPHVLPQAEAVCFSRDGAHIFVASESARALLRYDRP